MPAFRISRATLYRLFEPEGGLRSYVQEQQLNRAFAMLASPASAGTRIIDLALDFNFSGDSTFVRTFRRVTDTRSELGLRSDKSFAVDNAVLTLRGRVAWAHDFDPDRSIAATFQALPGASFVVNGAAQASDSALTTASVEMKWLNGWSAAATFDGEFSGVTRSYAGKGVIRYAW